jgi:hypothetical protein
MAAGSPDFPPSQPDDRQDRYREVSLEMPIGYCNDAQSLSAETADLGQYPARGSIKAQPREGIRFAHGNAPDPIFSGGL